MYTLNTQLPRIRRDAVRLLHRGWSARKVGRYLGFHHTAVMKWARKAEKIGDVPLHTRSSRPKRCPHRTDGAICTRILDLRIQTGRCTEAIHLQLQREGTVVSKSTIHRILDRSFCLKKRSPYRRYHAPVERPHVHTQGDLVEVDTIHLMMSEKKRLYVYTLIDVHSRWVYAKAVHKIRAGISLQFLKEAQRCAPFRFSLIQTDHGPEFSRYFQYNLERTHRFTRIGKPNDNAHIERFNRTIQEECLDRIERNVSTINCRLKTYLPYYNQERIHLSLHATPQEVVLRS
jgi:transposase InsO family protein